MPQTNVILYSGEDFRAPVFVAARNIQKNDEITENDLYTINVQHPFIVENPLVASQNIKLGDLITIGVDTIA
jgi:hypothetical protein